MTEKKARKYARVLKGKLRGKGWKIRLWQNWGGWYYELTNGGIQLHESGITDSNNQPHYWTLFSVDGGGGYIEWSVQRRNFKDPNKCVAAQLLVAKKDTQKRMDHIEKIEKNLRES